MNLISIFDTNVHKTPDKACLRVAGRSITYAEVQSRSRQAAHALAGLGVQRGDRVALMCFNTTGFVYAMLGAWRLGATLVPVNHKLQAPEVRYILEHSKSRVCIGDGALAPVLKTLADAATCLSTDSPIDGLQDFDALCAAAPSTPLANEVADENSMAEILYTSGTTGRPKGCVHSHRNVVLTAINAALGLSITRDERTLLAMPIWHASPLNNWLNGTLYMGGTVVMMREYHPLKFLQTVQDERVTLFFGAPVAYSVPLQVVPNFADFDLSSVRAWIYGGGPIGAELARKLAVAYRSETFFQVYGMTEAGPVGTTLYPNEQVAKAASIGAAAGPAVDMRVVREDGADARRGETGEIWLRTESAMQGYLDDPEATRKAFSNDGWYKSGDIARVDEDGYLFIVDRMKDMIVTGGENVYSKEIEDVLSAHSEIADVAVIGAPHPEWGETVVAHIVVAKGCNPSPESLREYLADKLAKYKIPREWVFAATLPRTPTGKLQKFLLRKS
ncbi:MULTISPECIES: class I adenylate-forming enzyme family protein [unclassified Variovorax]|uniref:class I adenylate-forming enzyme family protein n=1 Tax=unclassified Variovorax TaxID=663243 RepID=UPI001BD6686E|nr:MULTISPECIES: long-chain-fatty-acid--CoA ligase [unclassified Variovorax]